MLCNLKFTQKSAEVSTPLHPLVPLGPPTPPFSPPLHYWGPSALTSPGGIFQHIVQLVHRGQHSVGQFKSMIIIGNGSINSTYHIRLIYYQKWQIFPIFFSPISLGPPHYRPIQLPYSTIQLLDSTRYHLDIARWLLDSAIYHLDFSQISARYHQTWARSQLYSAILTQILGTFLLLLDLLYMLYSAIQYQLGFPTFPDARRSQLALSSLPLPTCHFQFHSISYFLISMCCA